MSSRAPIILTIRRQGNVAVYDLFEVEPLSQNIRLEIDENMIANLIKQLRTLTDSVNEARSMREDTREGLARREFAEDEFRNLGRVIFDQLLPRPVQNTLADRSGSNLFFRLEDNLVEIPWELAFDGNEFLGKRFPIGRQVITSHPFIRSDESGRFLSADSPAKMLIVANPTEFLPAASEEANALADALDGNGSLEVEIIGGSKATKVEVLSRLNECDLLHYAGHSAFDPRDGRKTGWRLYDGILTSEQISKISKPPLLVFSNSCESAATKRWDSLEQASLGIGGSFLVAGVRHYVGALWVIHDESSARFASAFYESLLQGNTVGGALFDAKWRDSGPCGFESLTASGYVHYGRPDDALDGHAPKAIGRKLQASGKEAGEPAGGIVPPAGKWKALVSAALFSGIMLVSSPLSDVPNRDDSDSLQVEYRRGVEEYAKADIPGALAIFQGLGKRPDNSLGLGAGDLAEIYLEAGVEEQAGKILDTALAGRGQNTKTWLIKGHLASREGDLREAERAYAEAAALDNGLPGQTAEAYNALGVLGFLDGKKEKAIQYFEKAVSKQEDNPEAVFNLGVIACLESREARAKELVTRLLGSNPGDELALMFLGALADGTGMAPSPEERGKVLLIGPVYQTGGTVQRLGAGWLFAHLLHKVLAGTRLPEQYALRVATSLDFPRPGAGEGAVAAAGRKLREVLKPLRVQAVVYGDLELFHHVAHARLKIMDVASGAILRSINITADGPNKIHELAGRLKDELAGPDAGI